MQTSDCKWATALSILVIIVYFFSYSQGHAESGGLASPVLSKGGGDNFSSQYHMEFHGQQDLVETNLLQLFTHPQHSEWFSTLSVIIFEVNSVAEQKQTYW